MSTAPLAIIGLGAVGTALAHACARAGVPVAAVASRSPAKAEDLAAAVGARAVSIAEASASASLIALTVADRAIEDAAALLGGVEGRTVFHASGSRPSTCLGPLASRGAHVASWHPLAAIAARHGPDAPEAYADMFRGAAVAIEGHAAALPALRTLATALGARPFDIAADDKPAYHLGAAILAGFSVALAEIADAQWRSIGLPPEIAHDGLAHLLGTVAANLAAAPAPGSALTGPIVRGDVEALARQAARARELSPAAAALYRAHTTHLITLALGASRITPETAEQLALVIADLSDAP